MRVVIQRVSEAAVRVDGQIVGQINQGLLVLLGIETADTEEDVDWLVNKTLNLRIFNDANGVMNTSLLDVKGGLLVISQFTLMAATKKGNRPSYIVPLNTHKPFPSTKAFAPKPNNGLANPYKKAFLAPICKCPSSTMALSPFKWIQK